MHRSLRKYQRDAVRALVHGESKALSAEMGLGKTLMAIAYAQEIGAKNILWIAPATVRLEIAAQMRRWWPEAWVSVPFTKADVARHRSKKDNPQVTIFNADKLSRDATFADALSAFGRYDLLVIDEAQTFKNSGARRTAVLWQNIIPMCEKVLPMSGSFIVNHAGDIYPILRMLAPELLERDGKVMTEFAFQNEFCTVEQRRVGARTIRVVTGSRNMPALKARLGNFFYSLTKAECLPELPPMTYQIVPLNLNATPMELMELARYNKTDIDDDAFLSFLSAEEGDHLGTLLQKLGYEKAHAAADYLQEFLFENDRKVIVWANNHSVIDALMSRMSDFDPVKIDGRDSHKARAQAVDTFLNDPRCRIFIGNIRAAGVGITLLNDVTKPSDVFFVQQDWAPGQNAQAAARCHRIGQTRGVIVRVFAARSVDLDERIQKILTRKQTEIMEIM